MNYANIKYLDIADGTGLRTSLYVSGCTNNCPGCFNKEAQDFNYGELFTREIEDRIIKSIDQPYVLGLTLLGGDPLEPSNADALYSFVCRFRDIYHNTKTIWVYSGYTYDYIMSLDDTDSRKMLVSLCDIMVDGRFVEELKDITLKFRGSSNQRIIDIHKSTPGSIVIADKV